MRRNIPPAEKAVRRSAREVPNSSSSPSPTSERRAGKGGPRIFALGTHTKRDGCVEPPMKAQYRRNFGTDLCALSR